MEQRDRMPDEPKIELRLKWRKTWPDREQDFVGLDELSGTKVGRIYVSVAGDTTGSWLWHYQASLPGLPWSSLNRGGVEETARRAAKAIEDVWFKAIEGSRYDAVAGRFVPADAGDGQETG